jgi:hypothetical protein
MEHFRKDRVDITVSPTPTPGSIMTLQDSAGMIIKLITVTSVLSSHRVTY